MLEYKYVFFDLDGTVTDPITGITRCVAYALERFGIHVEDTNTLAPFIGPPLKESFMKFYGFDEGQADEAVRLYRERFSVTGLFENEEYPGMAQLLHDLKAAGKTVVLATSKPQVYAQKILEHFDYAKYFDFAAGSELSGERIRKSEVIEYALENIGQPDRAECVMVGDREHDIIGAREAGMRSVGVLFGYGSREELEHSGAGYICPDVASLRELLLG